MLFVSPRICHYNWTRILYKPSCIRAFFQPWLHIPWQKRGAKLEGQAEDPTSQLFVLWWCVTYFCHLQINIEKTTITTKENLERLKELEPESCEVWGSSQTLSFISQCWSVFLCWVCWVRLCMGALWLAKLSLWHPVEPCFLLISLTFILMTALSVFYNHSLQLSPTNPFLHYSFLFLFLSLSGIAPWLVCYYPFPTPSKEDKACD